MSSAMKFVALGVVAYVLLKSPEKSTTSQTPAPAPSDGDKKAGGDFEKYLAEATRIAGVAIRTAKEIQTMAAVENT